MWAFLQRLIKAIRFKRKFGGWRNYPTDEVLSGLLEQILVRVNQYKDVDQFDGQVSTPDGIVVEFWRSNKYYAYANSGTVTLNGTELHRWSSVMPTPGIVAQLSWWEEHYGGTLESAEQTKLKKLTEIVRASNEKED